MGAFVELVKALAWPVVAVLAFFAFKGEIKGILSAVAGERLKLKAGPGGVEVTPVEKSVASVAAAASAKAASESARADAALAGQTPEQAQQAAQAAARAVAQATTPDRLVAAAQSSVAAGSSTRPRRILWADDNPAGNKLLAEAFRSLGIEVVEARSTDDAIQSLSRQIFDLVITDMARDQDREAGLALIQRMREASSTVPVIIYAAGWAAAHRGQEAARSVALISNQPDEVYLRALALLGARG